MNLPSAILFDLDDTLVTVPISPKDLFRTVAAAHRDTIVAAGSSVARLDDAYHDAHTRYWNHPVTNQQGRLNAWRSRYTIIADALTRAGVQVPGLARTMAREFHTKREEGVVLIPGAKETLAWFHARNVPMAVLSNGSRVTQRRKLNRFGLTRYFRIILIEGEQGVGKPDPEVYRRALEACNATAETAWCVGDNIEWDVTAPQKLGFVGIWIDSSGAGLPPEGNYHPDIVIASVHELVELAGA